MNNSEGQVIQKFRERIASNDFSEDVKIIYRVAGGIPSQRFELELVLYGSGVVQVKKRDMLGTVIPLEASSELQSSETLELLQQIADGIDSLVTRSEASFQPDSLVGSITIDVDGEMTTLYFPVNDEDKLLQESSITPQMDHTIQQLGILSQRLLLNDEVNDE